MRAASRPHRPRISSRFPATILRYAASRGADTSALSEGLDVDAAGDPRAHADLADYYTLIERTTDALGDPLLALRLAEWNDPKTAYDALAFLCVSSPTLEAALERTVRFQRVWVEGEKLTLRRQKAHAVLRYEPYGPSRAAHATAGQMFVLDMVVGSGRALGTRLRPLRASFRGPPFAGSSALAEALGVTPRFLAATDEVVLGNADLARALPRADPALAALMERMFVDALAILPPEPMTLGGRVLELLRGDLDTVGPDRSSIPERLRLTRRTLQRRLRSEGTSLEDLLDRARRTHALGLLARGTPIGETAYLVGYSDTSAFHRAFRRWTGLTPRRWALHGPGDRRGE